jgi:flagellin
LLIDLVDAFLEDSPQPMAELREAINTGYPLCTERLAYSLKGAVSNVGAKTAYALAYELETLGRQAKLDNAPSVLQQLEAELERLSAYVAKPGWEEQDGQDGQVRRVSPEDTKPEASLDAQRTLAQTTIGLGKTMQRLSSGLRISRASDDVAGLAVAETLRAQSRSFAVAARNANDGISLLGVAEGSMQVIADNLVRMRELAEQAASGTLTNAQGSALQMEFSNLQSEIDCIVDTTKFNGVTMLSASATSIDFQVGVDSGAGNVISPASVNVHASALGVGSTVDVSTQTAAQAALASLDSAISSLAQTRGTFGVLDNRLQTTISNIQNAMENLSASESRIRDVDMAAQGQTPGRAA